MFNMMMDLDSGSHVDPSASGSPPPLDVHRLEPEGVDSESAVLLKLTDESMAAIQKALKQRGGLKIRIDPNGGGVIELSESSSFRFSSQPLPSSAEVIACDRHGYSTNASVHCKYTIQATDKTFAETREKTQKLLEGEKNRGTRDVSRNRRDERSSGGGNSKGHHHQHRVGGGHASSSSSSRPAFLKADASSASSRLSSPNKFGSSSSSSSNSTGSNGVSSGAAANNGSSLVRPSMSAALRSELMKKKMAARVMHLVVTGRFTDCRQVYDRLKKDGLSEDADDFARIEKLVDDCSDRADGKLQLKPSLCSQIDPRWQWFTTDEKALVRRLQSAGSANFAPTRKSGMQAMQAPSQPVGGGSATHSPESVPTPPDTRVQLSGGGMIAAGRRVSPKMPLPQQQQQQLRQPTPKKDVSPLQQQQTNIDILDEMVGMSSGGGGGGGGQKRKAHAPPPSATASAGREEKRARQESASPPEDPTTHSSTATQHSTAGMLHHSLPPPAIQVCKSRGGGSSTSSSRQSSPSRTPLASPPQPSHDWNKMFSEVTTIWEADRYFQMFHKDYPEYMTCFDRLQQIAAEFRQFERELNAADRGTKDYAKIERSIQRKYAHYEKDNELLKTRQRHADLRSKLDVLKRRLAAWERSQS